MIYNKVSVHITIYRIVTLQKKKIIIDNLYKTNTTEKND